MCVAEVFRRGIARRGIAGGSVILALSLGGPAARAQSLSTDDASFASPAASRLRGSPTFLGKRSHGLQEHRAQDDRQRRSPYFDRWGIELSVGHEMFTGLPGEISTEGFFLSAGLYIGGSLAVIAETGTTGWATGRLTTPGRAPQKFGSGRALAAGGGIDAHLNDRIVIRVMADYRRLAVPSLEGMESVFMASDGARLDMGRVAVGLVLGI